MICYLSITGRVNFSQMASKGVFTTTTIDDGGTIVTLHYAKLYAVCLKRVVGVVIAVYDDPEKKTQTRKVFFSTDLTLTGEQIYLVYRSRFSIGSVKLLTHNAVMIQRIISTFGKSPNLNLNQSKLKEFLFLGVKNAA